MRSPLILVIVLLSWALAGCESKPSGALDGGASGTCDDGAQGGDETDLDCGGEVCPACANEQGCGRGSDCRSNLCTDGICVGQLCDPGVGNCDLQLGCETPLDTIENCGACGRICPSGDDGREGVCVAGVCEVAACFVERFDGAALAAHWQVAAGAAPTYSLGASTMVITDAPFATTPSAPGTSWIYEPDTDLGNQLAWSLPLGAADFAIDVDLAWTSSGADLTHAGIGLTNADHQLELQVGVSDGSGIDPGRPFARLRRPGADLGASGALAETASHSFSIRRVAGVLTVLLDGEPFLSDAALAEIAHVVIFAVPHRNGDTTYSFGEMSVGDVSICP